MNLLNLYKNYYFKLNIKDYKIHNFIYIKINNFILIILKIFIKKMNYYNNLIIKIIKYIIKLKY